MLRAFNAASLAILPIAEDNYACLTDKHGKDRRADWDIYVLDGDDHWVWAGFAWNRKQAWSRAKQKSYDACNAVMAVGEDDDGYAEFFFAYGKVVA